MKIELTKTVNITKWQVVASYKERIKSDAYVGILKYALEQGDEGVIPQMLYDNLLKPLSYTACKNILFRLREKGYFRKNEEDEKRYYLTNLGRDSALDEVFYDDKTSVLNIYYCASKLLEQSIVKIEVVDRPPNLTEKETRNSRGGRNFPMRLNETRYEPLKLGNKVIIIENFNSEVVPSKTKEVLKIISTKNRTNLNLLQYQQDLNRSYFDVKEELLYNAFSSQYNGQNLSIPFNKNNLNFKQNINIDTPRFLRNEFDYCMLENIPVQPISINCAMKWHLALLSRDLKKHFIHDNEFQDYEQQKRKAFYAEHQPYIVSKNQMINYLQKHPKSFYKIAKLETANLLTYKA